MSTSLSLQRDQRFESLIVTIEQGVFVLVKAMIHDIEDTLIHEYALARDIELTKQRFEKLSEDVGKLLAVLPQAIEERLSHFRYWIHRTRQFDLMGEWSSTGSRSARVWVFSRNHVADELGKEIAAMLGLFGEVLVAHLFTNIPAVQVAELPAKGNTMFVMYNNECCYARPIDLPESMLHQLVEYFSLAADLADEHRANERQERSRNAEALKLARDLARR